MISLRNNGSKSILVIGAHPDDTEIMAGGLISRAVLDGFNVYSVVVSDGCENGEAKIRQEETKEAGKILGLKEIWFCGIKDGTIIHDINMVRLIEKFVREVDPFLIITHSPQDTHQDHKNLCSSVLSAARRRPCSILMGETPSSYISENLVYADITDTIGVKIKALSVHESQIKDGPINLRNIKITSEFRGQNAGVEYAECFVNWRTII